MEPRCRRKHYILGCRKLYTLLLMRSIAILRARRYHLSHAYIQMARELGLNPKKFGSLANTKQDLLKLQSPEFI